MSKTINEQNVTLSNILGYEVEKEAVKKIITLLNGYTKYSKQGVSIRGMPNHGLPCGVILRNDGRKGGGDWLNACNDSYVPAIITEATFLSNPEHARFLGKEKNAIRYAEAIGHGVVNYLKAR